MSALGLVACALHAQVEVAVDFDKTFYLADEPVEALVRITNFSGRTISLGRDPGWLFFTVEARDGFLVRTEGTLRTQGVFQVPNASRATRRVRLTPYFQLARAGEYKVVATVTIADLKQQMTTQPHTINIMSPTKLWEQRFGVPNPEGPGGVEIRKYALLRALNNNRLELYIRVSDRTGGRIFNVFSIGNLVSFGNPEAQIDRLNYLHVLQQYDARSFRYVVVSPEGQLVIRHRYDYSDTRPHLAPQGDGHIQVAGGVRVTGNTDYPKDLAELNGAPDPAQPAGPRSSEIGPRKGP